MKMKIIMSKQVILTKDNYNFLRKQTSNNIERF